MRRDDLENGDAVVIIAGEEVKVNATDPVKSTLKRITEEKGLDSFTILVDGEEIESSEDLPETFEGNNIEVKRYVKAGN